MKNKIFYLILTGVQLFFLTGCWTNHEITVKDPDTHKVEAEVTTNHMVEVKPIQITIDINLKIDRELDDYFKDLDNLN